MPPKAVIMAAGQGIRLQPLTNTRPKVMLPVAGRPILWHLLQEAKKAGIRDCVIIVRYQKEQIIDYFKQNDPGVRLTFVEQGPENGTGAAVRAAEPHLQDTFMVLAGDIVLDSAILSQVREAHTQGITLAVQKVANPHAYGVVELSRGRVSLVEEKPEHPKSDLANLSVYCMEPTVLDDLKKIPLSPRGERELVHLLVGARAVPASAFWMDVAYPWHLFDAQDYLLEKLPAKTGEIENATINGKVIMEKGARIFDSYIEGRCFIGANSIVGPHAVLRGNVALGAQCEVGGSTTIKNSILFDRVKAKHLSYIGDSILGEGVNVGSGTQLANFRFDEGPINVQTERGWVNTGRKKLGAVVGDETRFGVLSCVMPGKRIGEQSWISSGVIVNRDIAPRTRVFVKQELTEYQEKS